GVVPAAEAIAAVIVYGRADRISCRWPPSQRTTRTPTDSSRSFLRVSSTIMSSRPSPSTSSGQTTASGEIAIAPTRRKRGGSPPTRIASPPCTTTASGDAAEKQPKRTLPASPPAPRRGDGVVGGRRRAGEGARGRPARRLGAQPRLDVRLIGGRPRRGIGDEAHPGERLRLVDEAIARAPAARLAQRLEHL